MDETALDKLAGEYRAFLRGRRGPLTAEQLDALRRRYATFEDHLDDDGVVVGGELHVDRLDTALRWVTDRGYEPVFFHEGFLGGPEPE